MGLTAATPAGTGRRRLAVISSHPVQYYAPWFRCIAEQHDVDLRVFFLFEPLKDGLFDRGFKREVRWDMPLLEGYAHEFVPNTSKAPGTHHFGGLRNPGLTAAVRKFAPDAVLLVGYNYRSLLHFILAWPARRVPLLLRGDSHRLVPDESASAWIKRCLITLLFRRFSAFLYVGAANRRYFELHGAREKTLFRVPHAVDNRRFAADPDEVRAAALAWRRELGIDDGRMVVLFAGKFETKKRPLDLLRAFRQLRLPGAALLFVGSGELEGELRAAAAGVREVFFAPFQNQTLMPRTYAACDLLVLPSFGPSETWGLAVNEAMCLGKPAIVSSHVGCAEDLVIPEETGLIFPAGDVNALAATLAHALEDRTRLARWGEAARERVRGYSYEAATAGLLRALDFVDKQAA